MSTSEVQPSSLPTITDLCLNVPLFQSFRYDESTVEHVRELVNYDEHIDCYCMECHQPSVFHVHREDVAYWFPEQLLARKNLIIEQIYSCSRDYNHELYFYFRIHDNTLAKIGQFPSIADLASVEIQKYRKVLGDNYYGEFNRAIGLVSHGIGIGAFVYLRRIFEHLIEEAHQKNAAKPGWDEEKYQMSRMDEKIKLLKDSLPEFLVENKSLYSILSLGLHELDESTCLQAFPVTRVGIELILDQKLEELNRVKKVQEASKDIGELYRKLQTPKTK